MEKRLYVNRLHKSAKVQARVASPQFSRSTGLSVRVAKSKMELYRIKHPPGCRRSGHAAITGMICELNKIFLQIRFETAQILLLRPLLIPFSASIYCTNPIVSKATSPCQV